MDNFLCIFGPKLKMYGPARIMPLKSSDDDGFHLYTQPWENFQNEYQFFEKASGHDEKSCAEQL